MLTLDHLKVMVFTQRVMSEYTVWFFVFLIVSATWTIMSLMTAAMLANFKTTRLADGLQRMQAREKVGRGITYCSSGFSGLHILFVVADSTTFIS